MGDHGVTSRGAATSARIQAVGELLGGGPSLAAPAELPRRARSPVEPTHEGDRYADYVLAPYDPAADPSGKLRSVNLLYETFAAMDVEPQGAALVASLREGLGQGYTVWGAKHLRGRLTWELYFYNPDRAHPRIDMENVGALFAPVARVEATAPRRFEWHMFSIEITAEDLRRGAIESVHVYVNGKDGHGASRSYELRGGELRLENLYTFHDPRLEIDAIVDRLHASVHIDPDRATIAAALWPELYRCRRVCVANKSRADGMYFSGVTVEQVLFLAKAQGWPPAVTGFLEPRRGLLDHLRWDVGFDFFTPAGAAAPTIEKSAIYATF